MYSFSSSTRNQHPHYGLDPGKKEGKREKKRIPRPHFGLDPCKEREKRKKKRRKLIHEEPAPSLVWTRARRKGSVGRRGERLPLLPAAVLSSSTRNQHPHYGLDPGKKEEKRRKKWRKAAT